MSKFIKTYQSDLILAIMIALISAASFNLGKISAYQQKKTPITITSPSGNQQEMQNQRLTENIEVVASKNSVTKLYHFPWCAGTSKISEKNKITFENEATAISAGYTLAGNCTK